MPIFSRNSIENLSSCHPDLKTIMWEVIKGFDCIILEGYRDQQDQEKAFADGNSKLNWPESKHNSIPSMAVDIAPFPVDWKDTQRFVYLAGYVMGVAAQLQREGRIKHEVVWGGDWDSDQNLSEERFRDLGHFELKG